MALTTAVVAGLALFGLLFAVVAVVGVLRFPDLYTRAHAVSKSDTLGVGLVLAAAAVASGSVGVTLKILFLFAFMLVTSPIAAHVLARSASLDGVEAWQVDPEEREEREETEDDQ
jgi:multicomponent Na+:H+ antiporter subunit G